MTHAETKGASPKESVLQKTLIKMEKKISELTDTCDILFNKLEPCINPNEPLRGEENTKSLDEMHSPCVTTLNTYTRHIHKATMKLKNMIDSLET